MRLLRIAFTAFIVLISCGERRDILLGEEAVCPTPKECLLCHQASTLTEARPLASQREVMRNMGEGVRKSEVLVAFLRIRAGVEWVKRGSHSPSDLNRCNICHPKHGVFRYPKWSESLAVLGGTDCATGCHRWLGEIEEEGFYGSIKPEVLLNEVTTAHTVIYQGGYQPEVKSDNIKVEGIRPGCGGCHALFSFEHGAISNCTDCHDFSSRIHSEHVGQLSDKQEVADTERSDMEVCGYCHAPSELFRAACYNCHLSGHQPFNDNGLPHYWNAPP